MGVPRHGIIFVLLSHDPSTTAVFSIHRLDNNVWCTTVKCANVSDR